LVERNPGAVKAATMTTIGTSAIVEMEQWLSTFHSNGMMINNNNSDTITPPTPDGVQNTTTMAHSAIQFLRDNGDERCLFLRTIMEIQQQQQRQVQLMMSSNMEELLFHCVLGCRHVILGQWQQCFSVHFLRHLRDYFMVCGHNTQHRSIRLAFYTTAASFWKRAWNTEDDPNSVNSIAPVHHPLESRLLSEISLLPSVVTLRTKEELFSHLNVLMQHEQQQQAAEFLECVLSEFGSKSTAVNYRMPLEFHKNSHKAFETKGALDQSLQLAITTLSHLTSSMTERVDSTIAVLQLINAILGWEFGTASWNSSDSISITSNGSLIRPPAQWHIFLGQVDIVHALFRMHEASYAVRSINGKNILLQQTIRQILLQLASFSGSIFPTPSEQMQYASALCEGSLHLIEQVIAGIVVKEESSIVLDIYQLMSRLVSNFRLPLLLEVTTFVPLLKCVTQMGCTLLTDHVRECEIAGGDMDSMEHHDWREETIGQLLDCVALISGDQWLWYGGTDQSRYNVQINLSDVVSPLFDGFVICRTRMAALEEKFYLSNESDLDEVREGITETCLAEEIDSISTIGRLNLRKAISCLSSLCGAVMPRLHSLWDTRGEVTPDMSALLEEARLLTLYVCYLLTDNNEGESPSIPDAVVIACQRDEAIANDIVSAIQALLHLADTQTQRIATDPSNPRLSPLLAKTLLNFINRWAPAYICAADFESSNHTSRIVLEWSSMDKAKHSIDFCVSLCLRYLCYWPQEPPVRELAGKLLHSLARRSGLVRNVMVSSPSFQIIVRCHCLVAGIRHTISQSEFESTVRGIAGGNTIPSLPMLWGYQRLPYQTKALILTVILIACGDNNDPAATMINDSLKVIHEAFAHLFNALESKKVNSENVDVREMACLCVDMFCGLAQASEMVASERIPQVVSNYLPQLSGLMKYYANDMTVCETLLRFFRDYTAHFISLLDRGQSLILFQSSAELLRSYSVYHWSARITAEEEQSYNDIVCAIQLLINLGTKDFIDACSSNDGVDSSQVTDIIFFGLQQILPLMTQGLLQFQTLCSLFFELVGFMVDTYPEKVCALPLELFDSLLESLLFGMSHYDATVAKHSLQGIASITREHLSSGVLQSHLDRSPEIFDRCSKRLLSDVVYQTTVVDRMEATGMALLPLAACNLDRFAAVVQELSSQLPNQQQRVRLDAAFTKLLQPDVLAKASTNGYAGRMNRLGFKKSFELFVNEIHSFLVLR
jgi:hypothetical protein